jgi:hypothetical protein
VITEAGSGTTIHAMGGVQVIQAMRHQARADCGQVHIHSRHTKIETIKSVSYLREAQRE